MPYRIDPHPLNWSTPMVSSLCLGISKYPAGHFCQVARPIEGSIFPRSAVHSVTAIPAV